MAKLDEQLNANFIKLQQVKELTSQVEGRDSQLNTKEKLIAEFKEEQSITHVAGHNS